jgi:hypothetical protein
VKDFASSPNNTIEGENEERLSPLPGRGCLNIFLV